jgi:hypothetical protein
MNGIETVKVTSTEIIDERKNYIESCFYASLILIDLCDSTSLKSKKGFPDWIPVMQDFYRNATSIFDENGIRPIKFLGDAVLYMYPDFSDDNAVKYNARQKIKINEKVRFKELLDLCLETKNYWWESYKQYLRRDETCDQFQSITITIDYGLVIDFNQLVEGEYLPDPIGEVVDRCFRVSKILGKNHVACTSDFYNKLQTETDNCCSKLFEEVRIGALKGVKAMDSIRILLPSEEEIKWIISKKFNNISQNSDKLLNSRMQIHMLQNEISKKGGLV